MTKPNPIEIAVMPLREDAMARAEQDAKDYIEAVHAELAEHGWDINLAAPYPNSLGYSTAYQMARYKYVTYREIIEDDPAKVTVRSGRHPHFVIASESRAAKFIAKRKQQAAEEYDAFVAKLVAKIGPVVWAELDGNHVWSYSILTVELAGGERQRWKTKQIVNISKYGKFFNQWPTRKVK